MREIKIQSQIQNELKYKNYKSFSWVSDVDIFSLLLPTIHLISLGGLTLLGGLVSGPDVGRAQILILL